MRNSLTSEPQTFKHGAAAVPSSRFDSPSTLPSLSCSLPGIESTKRTADKQRQAHHHKKTKLLEESQTSDHSSHDSGPSSVYVSDGLQSSNEAYATSSSQLTSQSSDCLTSPFSESDHSGSDCESDVMAVEGKHSSDRAMNNSDPYNPAHVGSQTGDAGEEGSKDDPFSLFIQFQMDRGKLSEDNNLHYSFERNSSSEQEFKTMKEQLKQRKKDLQREKQRERQKRYREGLRRRRELVSLAETWSTNCRSGDKSNWPVKSF
eukprot:TRINITY_DN619_c0_g1_i4.p2 TRINITY_DN619_c0_g1~~TRINITY_DN619_c0_g1_i4.p2  ORF type:complete len:261 (+),score=37.58 TRINITY_DN619_c0_g1_i4:55-837(+)